MRMNKITFSDDYFLLIINIIPLLFMWILWNKSACKWLHTLLSWFILIFDMIFNEHSVVWWFYFTLKLRLLFFLNWIFLLRLRTLSRILLTLQYHSEWNYSSSHYLYYYHSSPVPRILGSHSKRTWFAFILLLSDQNKVSLKYEPGCFPDLHYLLTW